VTKLLDRLSHDKAVFVFTLAAGLPAVLVSLGLLWTRLQPRSTAALVSLLILVCWVGLAYLVRSRVVRPLQTMANLLLALRQGDFSVRAHQAHQGDPLGDILAEINSLSSILQGQRQGALEATALLRTVMEEIDVAIFAFDGSQLLRLVNRAGERLLAQPAGRSGWRNAFKANRAAFWSPRNFPGRLAAGECAASRFARTAFPFSSSSSPTSASPCAKRS